jgi:hypothetical protein
MQDDNSGGVATVDEALCLLHASHTPLEGLLEQAQSILAEACEREKSVKLPIEATR